MIISYPHFQLTAATMMITIIITAADTPVTIPITSFVLSDDELLFLPVPPALPATSGL